jgi:peptidoglycan/xylan/chitin deacetylase (PgdA/CDA1 family)
MYHYVRPLPDKRFPEIRGRSLSEFDHQLDFICANYTVVSLENVKEALEGGARLPDMAALLTFDDGYSDHFEHVLPRLLKRGITGAFFPPRMAAMDRKVLDVNKIQFVLASGTDPELIAKSVVSMCEALESDYRPGALDSYAFNHPYDSREVSFIKLMLSRELPAGIREAVMDTLFEKYVTADAAAFADDLYASVAQLRQMVDCGMHIGSHGDTHRLMNTLPAAEQLSEIGRSIELLDEVGMLPAHRSFSYPYGKYNADTLSALRAYDFKIGFGTHVSLTDLDNVAALEIPRLDTNHFPVSDGAAVRSSNEWFAEAQAAKN